MRRRLVLALCWFAMIGNLLIVAAAPDLIWSFPTLASTEIQAAAVCIASFWCAFILRRVVKSATER
ncbi:MAG: hypothetical protein ABSG86_06170 [Thermoguttaceae bacterium]